VELPTIKPGSPQWDAWREYFQRHLAWTPEVMRRIIDRSADAPILMTVPTEYPEHFDVSFRPSEHWNPPEIRQITPRDLRERLEELHRRYGPQWGIKVLPRPSRPLPKSAPSLTDEDLRRIYPKREEDAA